MSMDKSLKTKAALVRHRNVLSRAERIARLRDEARWEEGRSPFGLPKVAHRKAAVGGKVKKKGKAEGEEGAAAEPAAAPAKK
jgi:small basic protein (TIGR04137 family)